MAIVGMYETSLGLFRVKIECTGSECSRWAAEETNAVNGRENDI